MSSQSIGLTPMGTAERKAASPAPGALDAIFSGLARLAANACGSPLASIVVAGCGEIWCTPSGQLAHDAPSRPDPFASHAAQAAGIYEVPDTSQDDRFRHGDPAIGSVVIRSYAGCALRTAAGEILGTLGLYAPQARALSPAQRASLLLIAEQAVAQAEIQSRLTELALLGDAPAAASQPDVAARALLDSAPVAIYHTDAAGDMIYGNPEYRRMFGLQPGHSPDAWSKRVHSDDRSRMEQAWADFCRRPRPIRFESYRTLADDGSVRHFSEQVVAADGVSGWVGTISDFTDLVAARDHLRKAETMFRNTFDQAPIGIAHADRRGRLLRCNQSFWKMLGYEPDDLAHSTIADVTHSDDVARVAAELKRLWNGEIEFVDLEKRYIRKDGSFLWVRMTTALVRERDGTPEY